jgi:hypothetical protein
VGVLEGGVLYLLYEAKRLPLQLVRLLLNPLPILLFIEAQRLLRPLQYGRISLAFCT